jgi:hypothetical protein
MNIIDELGLINQTIAQLEADARKIKAELISRGVGKYNGTLFFAEVQHYDRATISPKLVREVLDADLIPSVTELKQVDAVVVKSLGE